MDEQKPEIQFPPDPLQTMNKKLDSFFFILFSVGLVFVVTLVVMTITLLIDSFHFNSATYKEYSEKTQIIDGNLKINQELLDQNEKNQQLILDQQKIIRELLKK